MVGVHFLPFSWLYEGQAYRFAAIAMSVGGSVTGWLFPEHTFVATPWWVVFVLSVTAVMLKQEVKADGLTKQISHLSIHKF